MEEHTAQSFQRLEVLRAIAEHLNSTLELQPMLDSALPLILDLMDLQTGWIALLDEESSFYHAAAHGLPPALTADNRAALRWTPCKCQQMLLDDELTEAVNIIECERLDQISIAEHEQRELEALRCHASVPLSAGGKVLGLMNLARTDAEPLSGVDLVLLSLVGKTLGSAIQRAQLFDAVQHSATTDWLTGLYNRRHFFASAERALEQARRYQHTLSVIMLDIDHFKRINDRYGHAAGDRVLQLVAQVFSDNLRKADVPARYGGEEFIAVMPETDLDAGRRAAQRLRAMLEKIEDETDGEALRITASLGVAALDESCNDLETLLKRADDALYTAKQAGRNRVAVWQRGSCVVCT